MSDENDELNIEVEPPMAEFVACHNHVLLFPWGTDTICAHLKALALRIDVRDASIEVFGEEDHRWKAAEKKPANVTPIRS